MVNYIDIEHQMKTKELYNLDYIRNYSSDESKDKNNTQGDKNA